MSTVRTPHGDEACSLQKSSSSLLSVADVDVHTAWDNYDLIMLPVCRRCSDDRCSLLTHWSDSTASLKSCFSHNATSRSLAVQTSIGVESDGEARWRRTRGWKPEGQDRCHWRRLKSRRQVDSDSSLRSCKSNSRNCQFCESTIQQCRGGTRRRTVTQLSTSRCTGRHHSTWSEATARRHHAADTRRDDDDEDYITTSSEGEDPPSTSGSSSAPHFFADDGTSFLSSSTTSSSAAFTVSPGHPRQQSLPAEPSTDGSSRLFYPSPNSHKWISSSRSLTTSNNVDDHELKGNRSSEQVTVAARCLSKRSEAEADQTRQDELRRAISLFEFRSSNELRIANDFIDGVWSLCSRRSLYNEQVVCPSPTPVTTTPPTSVFQLCCSRSENNFGSDTGCDPWKISYSDCQRSHFSDVTGNKQGSLRPVHNSQVVSDDNSSRRLNVADVYVVVRCDGEDASKDWKCSGKDYRPVEMIAKLSDVIAATSTEDSFEICVRKSPIALNNLPNNRESLETKVTNAEHCVKSPKLRNNASRKHTEDIAPDTLSHRQDDTAAVYENSPSLWTPLQSKWSTDVPGLKTLREGAASNSRFATELVQVFDALLVPSGVRETASVATDIKKFHPLTDGANEWIGNEPSDSSKFLKPETDSIATSSTKPTAGDGRSLENIPKSGIQASFNRSRRRKQRERNSDILFGLTPRLSVKADMSCGLEAELMSRSAELSLPKQQAGYDKCMTATTSTQTNDLNDDQQSPGETRKRISRKSRGRGKVRELVKLFESVSAPKLDNSSSPGDLKRATISAAVSVGELLRRASDQEVTPHTCSLLDINAKQTRISLPKSTEAHSNAVITQSLRSATEKYLLKREEVAVVQKSIARWPIMSRFRQRHAQKQLNTTASAPSGIDFNTLPKTRDSRSDIRTTAIIKVNEKLPRNDIRKTTKAVPLSSKENVKLAIENSSELQNASVTNSAKSSLRTGKPETFGYEAANAASTSMPIAVSGRPAVGDSVTSSSPVERQKTVRQLPSSPPSTRPHHPSKSLDTCEVTVTIPSNGGSGDVGSGLHEGRIESNNKRSTAHVDDEVHPSMNYAVHGRSTFRQSFGLARQQSTMTASTENATETQSPETAINSDCQRFSVQSWFTVGGPCLVEVPRWPLTSGKDVVAIQRPRKSKARNPAKATLMIETSCLAPYLALRMPGTTVHQVNDVDVNKRCAAERNAEYTASSSSGGERRTVNLSTKKQSLSSGAQAEKQYRSKTEIRNGDEQLSAESVSRQPKSEKIDGVTMETNEHKDKFDVAATTSSVSRGHGDKIAVNVQKYYAHPERGCEAVTPVPPTNPIISDHRPRSVESHAQSHDPTSKRYSSDKEHDAMSPMKTSSVMTKCGLVSGESVQSRHGVTVVYNRRRRTSTSGSARPVSVTKETQTADRTQPRATANYNRLAQQFLLTSLLEYRLDAQRKQKA